MDKTLLNLLTILVTGSGVFAVLTKFSVPELRGTFWGSNPFMLKRDIIDSTMTWVFTSLAVVGLSVQVLAEILGEAIPDRLYSSSCYLYFLVAGLLCMILLLLLLNSVGKRFARRKWLPLVIASQADAFRSVQSILVNDGWRDDQLAQKGHLTDPDKYRAKNLEHAADNLTQIEKLLDLSSLSGDLKSRTDRLRRYFDGERTT